MKLSEELSVAFEVAKEAGKLIIRQFKKRKIIGLKSNIDFVTNVDKNSEKLITFIIKKNFPDHGILSEEGTRSEGDSENLWVIDPLDGTTNFMHGYPFFCVSISLVRKNKQALGVVYDPLRKEMFHSLVNKGSFLNGKRIKVSKTKDLENSLIVTGFYYDRGEIMRKTVKSIEKFYLKNVHGIRRSGSAALDLCHVSCGRTDGYWELMLNPWDFAAGSLIVKEAGGIVTTAEGKPLKMKTTSILAANKYLHKKMLEVLNR
jgi:myo-inositol-1(or 4)-monophosphatase